ncbi:phosphoglycolate phosphatase [Parvibium lacunae]|uniref:phosphoglycolate phosphatase n=1 Tax=Parvibium lacunae TaxID=1888893 RepID=A0A368L6J4_9BURK|nr:phosphoglycolate phosphatase [Parvibium lacunae]RCS59234.1 phosphoglycolate phosphatase [Parvibium lacunae]
MLDPASVLPPTSIAWRAVLFDLDGTLADTAGDLAAAANAMREARNLAPLSLAELRPYVSQGARGMLGRALQITPDNPAYPDYQTDFLSRYAARLCVHSHLFDGMPWLLDQLEAHGLAWGIVTNKHTRFTNPLVEALQLFPRTRCVVSGDTTAHAKPHPAPLLHAATLLEVPPATCLYVGDDARDITAGQAAGMKTAAAAYGYCGESDPSTWQADWLIHHPHDLLTILNLPQKGR